MPPFIDLRDQKFGKLTVIRKHPERANGGGVRWICKCECGGDSVTSSYNLRNGIAKTCGCYTSERVRANPPHTTHGMTGSPTYLSWAAMKNRCLRTNSHNWKYYGGRGIRICKKWHSFVNFFADMGERPLGKSLDRINNSGNYTPKNCKWSTHSEQTRNTRRNKGPA